MSKRTNSNPSPRTESWAMPLVGSLVPWTAFTFVPERFRMIVGGIAVAMVAWALVILWMQD